MRALALGLGLFGLVGLAACSVPGKFLVDGGGSGDGPTDGMTTGDATPSGNIVWIRSLSTFTPYGLAAGSGGLTMVGGFTVPGDLGGGTLSPTGNYDMVVAAFNESDASHIYSKKHGDTGSEFGFMDTTDATGSPLVYGLTGLTPYDLGQGSTASSGGADGFIGRYGASAPAWVNRMYGSLDDKFLTSARGAGSTIYGAGFFEGTTTWNSATLTSAGGRDAFLVRMNTFTGAIDLTKQYGGVGRDEVSGLASVMGGGVLMCGMFDDTIFLGSHTLASSAALDIYVAKLDTSGDPTWQVRYGGAGDDRDVRASVDPAGDIYITGQFQQSITFGTTTLTSNGGADIFVAKLSGTDGSAIWAKSWGGSGDDGVRGTMVDSSGRLFVAGWAVGAIDNGTTLGGADAVVTSYNTTDGSIRWRHVYSTAGDDRAWPAAFGSSGDIYVGIHLGGAYDFGKPMIGPANPSAAIVRFAP